MPATDSTPRPVHSSPDKYVAFLSVYKICAQRITNMVIRKNDIVLHWNWFSDPLYYFASKDEDKQVENEVRKYLNAERATIKAMVQAVDRHTEAFHDFEKKIPKNDLPSRDVLAYLDQQLTVYDIAGIHINNEIERCAGVYTLQHMVGKTYARNADWKSIIRMYIQDQRLLYSDETFTPPGGSAVTSPSAVNPEMAALHYPGEAQSLIEILPSAAPSPLPPPIWDNSGIEDDAIKNDLFSFTNMMNSFNDDD